MSNKGKTRVHGDLSSLPLFLMETRLENFWNVKSLDVEVVSSHAVAMGHKQPGSEVQEDVTVVAVPSPTAPEAADSWALRRSCQKPRASTPLQTV